MRYLLLALMVVLFAAHASATVIGNETMTVESGDREQVVVERYYEDITGDQISYLVSSRYEPRELTARDAIGPMECRVDELDIGTEIVCDPRVRTNYTVTFSFTADLTEPDRDIQRFSYVKRVVVPTGAFQLQVVLPEGYGLVGGDDQFSPAGGVVGSEGRRIFVTWTEEEVSIGDTLRYELQYEELRVLDRLPMSSLLVVGLFGALLIVTAIAYHFREKSRSEQTIASVFPVLKEDEQAVLRYIIEHDDEAVEQRDIVTDIDYSKAKISQLLSDLEERGLIEKEKQGRVNVIRLAREIGDM